MTPAKHVREHNYFGFDVLRIIAIFMICVFHFQLYQLNLPKELLVGMPEEFFVPQNIGFRVVIKNFILLWGANW